MYATGHFPRRPTTFRPMKVVESIPVFERGAFPKSLEWQKAKDQVHEAVKCVDWPHGAGTFTIYPERATDKKGLGGNGVLPIKEPCITKLEEFGWEVETLPEIIDGVLGTGDLDAVITTSAGKIAFEWETGNISSAHRAINKLLMGLKFGGIIGAILVVPSNRLKVWLTERIGNIGELRPYFRLWDDAKLQNDEGVLQIIVCEHDAESTGVPRIPKQFGGNSKAGRAMREARRKNAKRKAQRDAKRPRKKSPSPKHRPRHR